MLAASAFIDKRTPECIQVYQITEEPGGSRLVYPDQPCFLADRRRFVLTTTNGPAVCDPDDNCALRYLFPPEEAESILVTADGRYGYFRRKADATDKELTIGRVDLANGHIEDIFHTGSTLPGSDTPVSSFRLETVSANNERIAFHRWLGDGCTPNAPHEIIVVDLVKGDSWTVWADPEFTKLSHLRYCISDDPEWVGDLIVQHNHGALTDESGKTLLGLGPPADRGVDLHIISDDGLRRRDPPFGRDGIESCIGHQVWRGRTGRSVASVSLQNCDNSYGWADGTAQQVVAGEPVPTAIDAPHAGRLHPGANPVCLSDNAVNPRFCHLSCDDSGRRFAFDTFPVFDGERAGMQVITGSAAEDTEPLEFHYILNSGVTFNAANGYHAHPVLAPDGRFLLFNSNITGTRQGYLVTGLDQL